MSQVKTTEHINSEGHDEQLNCPNCISKYCKHNTSEKKRAEFLKQFLEVLPGNPQLLPLDGEGKAPIIRNKCRLDSPRGKNYLVSGQEAIRRIRDDGVPGFSIWAGKQTHNTKSLVFVDYDDVTIFSPSELPDTLTTRTGSGKGYHQIFINHGDVENARATGELEGAGEVRAHNHYIVTPGSIHPSGGVYHLENNRELSTLSSDYLPPELQPSDPVNKENGDIASNVTNTEFSTLRDSIDHTKVEQARTALNEFKQNHIAAFNCIYDRLQGGRGSYDSELSRADSNKIDRDLQEKTVLTHLYGVYKDCGHTDEQASELAYHLLSYYCLESNSGYTKDGNPRKWIKRNENYRQQQLQYAIEQFNQTKFQRFCNQSSDATTVRTQDSDRYSRQTRSLIRFIINSYVGLFAELSAKEIHSILLSEYSYCLSEEVVKAIVHTTTPLYNGTTGPHNSLSTGIEGCYPRKTAVTDLCVQVDRLYKGNSEASFDECLNNLRREGSVKLAQIRDGQDYRVYPSWCPDPSEADWVKTGGNRYWID